MRKFILLLTMMVIAAISFAQKYTVLDSTITPDKKYQYVNEVAKLSSLKQIVGKEKISTDTITHYEALQKFYTDIDAACREYLSDYIKIDTLVITEEQYQKDVIRIAEIREWVSKVLTDPDIEEATSFKEYRSKMVELNKLTRMEGLTSKQKTKNKGK